MAGRLISSRTDTVTAADSNGYVTVGSITPYYLGATVTLSKTGASLDGKIIEIDSTGNRMRLRITSEANDTNSKFSYGGQDCSAYNAASTVTQHAQLIYNVNDAPLT